MKPVVPSCRPACLGGKRRTPGTHGAARWPPPGCRRAWTPAAAQGLKEDRPLGKGAGLVVWSGQTQMNSRGMWQGWCPPPRPIPRAWPACKEPQRGSKLITEPGKRAWHRSIATESSGERRKNRHDGPLLSLAVHGRGSCKAKRSQRRSSPWASDRRSPPPSPPSLPLAARAPAAVNQAWRVLAKAFSPGRALGPLTSPSVSGYGHVIWAGRLLDRVVRPGLGAGVGGLRLQFVRTHAIRLSPLRRAQGLRTGCWPSRPPLRHP